MPTAKTPSANGEGSGTTCISVRFALKVIAVIGLISRFIEKTLVSIRPQVAPVISDSDDVGKTENCATVAEVTGMIWNSTIGADWSSKPSPTTI